MKRLLFVPALLLTLSATAAEPKVQLEIWGIEATDEITIDGTAVAAKGGGNRLFSGDPTATNAPVLMELAPGKHQIALLRGECAPRTMTVTLEGGSKRAIVFEKEDPERCAIPLLPARR